jgi:hypothetical protein
VSLLALALASYARRRAASPSLREKQGEGGKKIIQKIKRTKKKYNKRRYIKIAKSKYNTKIFFTKNKT